jgi:hypothetical protein
MSRGTKVTAFFLPPLPRRLSVRYHPKAAQIETASNGWVRRFLGDCFPSEAELLAYLRQRNGLYGPLVSPNAEESRARDVADWYQFVTIIDTFAADRGKLGASHDGALAEFATIMNTFGTDAPPRETGPFGSAAKDLWRRISPGLSPSQVRRFTDTLGAFLSGNAVEIRSKIADIELDYETCLAIRMDAFGCEFIELMAEYAAEVDVSDLCTAAPLTELHRDAMHQMIIVNDLLSWRKERIHDDRTNTVRVLCHTEGLSLQQAVNRLCAMADRHERAYIATRDQILSGPLGTRPDLRAYLEALDHVIGGSQEFEYLTPRYWGDGAVWDGTTYGWVSLTDPVTRFLSGDEVSDQSGRTDFDRGNCVV